jgi:hypothetical protein
MQGVDVPGSIYAHIAGVDIVRAGAGEYYVLEDNLRVPSGVSYMLEDRKMMMRLFPEPFAPPRGAGRALPGPAADQRCARRAAGVRPDGGRADAGRLQQRLLRTCLPRPADGRRTGRGPGPVRRDDIVYMRTTQGPQRVDVIYRRIDDDFLDPLAFRRIPCSACRACWRPIAPAT